MKKTENRSLRQALRTQQRQIAETRDVKAHDMGAKQPPSREIGRVIPALPRAKPVKDRRHATSFHP